MLNTKMHIFKKMLKDFSKSSYSSEALFNINPFKLHKLEAGPASRVTVSKEDGLKMLKQMQIVRRLETAAGNLYNEKYVRGFCHLYSGQEACAVGMWSAMRPVDCAISAYRVHGWTALMGGNVSAVLAELTGRQSGVARGKGGSMHMYARNFYGGNGIVGAQVPLGAGVAFACKYKQDGGVCLTLYGDGASNQVDGMDVLAVREATNFAIDYCTTGKGPILLETITYRYSGHSMSDPGTSYRTRDEIQAMRQSKDPILIFKNKLLTSNLATETEIKDIETDIKKIVETAVKLAKEDKEIPVEELTIDIYAKNVSGKIRGITPWDMWEHKNLAVPKNLE